MIRYSTGIDDMTAHSPEAPVRSGSGVRFGRRFTRPGAALTIGMLTVAVGAFLAPSAAADDATEMVRTAVAAARPAECGLRSEPIIDQAAQGINATTDRWINHTARAVPEEDALPILHDLGYDGTQAAILSAAGKSESDVIRALLLQGYKVIPDCSYQDFGVGTSYNETKELILATVVLAA